MVKQSITDGVPWENIVGYSRLVKIGNHIEVAGTVAVNENNELIGKGDPYLQTKFILQKIGYYLEKVGSSLNDIVRTRMFVTDISRWEQYGKAHGEIFSTIKPCTSMIEIKSLISPDYLIEIEVTAIIPTIE